MSVGSLSEECKEELRRNFLPHVHDGHTMHYGQDQVTITTNPETDDQWNTLYATYLFYKDAGGRRSFLRSERKNTKKRPRVPPPKTSAVPPSSVKETETTTTTANAKRLKTDQNEDLTKDSDSFQDFLGELLKHDQGTLTKEQAIWYKRQLMYAAGGKFLQGANVFLHAQAYVPPEKRAIHEVMDNVYKEFAEDDQLAFPEEHLDTWAEIISMVPCTNLLFHLFDDMNDDEREEAFGLLDTEFKEKIKTILQSKPQLAGACVV